MNRLIEMTSETKQLLEDITPNFEENLKRAFKNEGIRLQRKRKGDNFVHPLDDVLLTLNADTKIELRNLKFPWIPDFFIDKMAPNLQMSCLDVDFNLGTLRVEGTYEANNSALRRLLPVSHVGRVLITFNNVRAFGRIGLIAKHDSLVPQNYDLTYQPSDVAVRVGYHADADNEIENEITNSNVEGTLGQTVWPQLTETVSNLLHSQLGEAVVEFSLTELLVDRDEEFREYAKEQSSRANRVLDSLLCLAKDYVVSENWRTVKTPHFDAVYKGKASGVKQGTLETGTGYILDLSTLTRNHSFSLYEDKQKLTIYGSISLREFKHGYEEYQSEYEDIKINGSIKVAAYKNQIFLKISIRKEGERCVTQLESVRFTMIKDIDVDASGLASLSWLSSRLKSWVIGNLRHAALPVLEMYVKEAFVQAISITDCVSLLVD